MGINGRKRGILMRTADFKIAEQGLQDSRVKE
jgi:hypothetical protein